MSTVNNFMLQYGLSYPFLMDPTAEIGRMYRISSTPTTFFVDSDGVIRNVLAGVVTRGWLKANIDKFPILEG